MYYIGEKCYLAIIERRLQQTDKGVGVENDLLNDLGFNLCVAPWSLVSYDGKYPFKSYNFLFILYYY